MTTALIQSIRPQFRTIDGLAIRFAESEPRRAARSCSIPGPESLYCLPADLVAASREHAHLVAVDLPGFGHSEGRDVVDVATGDEGVPGRVADAFGVEQPHVVRPDVGPLRGAVRGGA